MKHQFIIALTSLLICNFSQAEVQTDADRSDLNYKEQIELSEYKALSEQQKISEAKTILNRLEYKLRSIELDARGEYQLSGYNDFQKQNVIFDLQQLNNSITRLNIRLSSAKNMNDTQSDFNWIESDYRSIEFNLQIAKFSFSLQNQYRMLSFDISSLGQLYY